MRPADLARRRAAAPADFFAAKGVLAGLLDTLRVPTGRCEPAPSPSRSCIPGAPRGSSSAGEPAGWLGEIHPLVARRVGAGPTRWPASSSTSTRSPSTLDRLARYRDLTSFPEVREDLAVIVADTVTAAEVLEVVRAAGGAAAAPAPRCSTSTATPSGSAPGNVSLALRLRFRAADRTLTDEEVAAKRREDRRRARRTSWRGGSVTPSVAVFGAAGYAGALDRAAAAPPPAFELRDGHRALRRRAGGSTSSIPTTASRSMLEELDLDRHAERRRRGRRLPARRRRRAGRRAARARRAGRRPERRLPAARRRPSTSEWYREHPAPELLDEAVYGLPERYREQIAGAGIVANPGCYPTADAARRSRRWRAPG